LEEINVNSIPKFHSSADHGMDRSIDGKKRERPRMGRNWSRC